MGQMWNNVNRKAEAAFKALIWSKAAESLKAFIGSDAAIFVGASGLQVTSPRIEVFCSQATPYIVPQTRYMTGNYHCLMEVYFIANYGHPAAEREAAMGELWDMFVSHSLPADVNNLAEGPADFEVIDDGNAQGIGWMVESISTVVLDGKEYMEVLRGDLYCKPSGKGITQ